MSYWRVVRYLNANGIVWADGDFTLIDRLDGQGPQIDQWDTAKLGSQPSQLALSAFSADPVATAGVVANTSSARAAIRTTGKRRANRAIVDEYLPTVAAGPTKTALVALYDLIQE